MKNLTVKETSRIIVPKKEYDLNLDKRLLIPFVEIGRIGFMDRDGKIIVLPRYVMCEGECYNETDLIQVSVDEPIVFFDDNDVNKRRLYIRRYHGLINYKGEKILDTIYFEITPAIKNNNILTVRDKDLKYGVIDIKGREIVPFGKYHYISGFDYGLARVAHTLPGEEKKWGIIDMEGKEILPLKYNEIWNFYDKGLTDTYVSKGLGGCGVERECRYKFNLYTHELLPLKNKQSQKKDLQSDQNTSDKKIISWAKYRGSYEQDVIGWSDGFIDSVLDGGSDTY